MFLTGDPWIHSDIVPCSSLDYYTEILKPYENSYKMVSDYLKGNIDFEVFLNSYLVLTKEHEFKQARWVNSDDYLKEFFPEEE